MVCPACHSGCSSAPPVPMCRWYYPTCIALVLCYYTLIILSHLSLFLLDKAKYRYSFQYTLSPSFSFSPVSLSDVQSAVQSAVPGSDQPQYHIDHHVIILPSDPQWSHPLISQLRLLSSDSSSSSQHSQPSPSQPQHTESQHRVSMHLHTKCTLWPLCFTIGTVFSSPAVCSKC